jgi:hypothetical protein
MIEIWKTIPGYEGWYDISNLGNVRRIRAGQGARAGKILKPTRNKNGYYFLALTKNGKPKYRKLHQLVCEIFNGPSPSRKHEPNHKDGKKKNNTAHNLEWSTRKENMEHSYYVLGQGIKRHKFISPSGEVVEINGLNKFCRIQSLQAPCMSRVATGKQNSHMGWQRHV